MLGDSSSKALGSSSGDAPAPAPASTGAAAAHHHDGSSEEDRMKLGSGGDEFGDRSFGGNRWPRQETIALLKIRSDMDVVFRDASVKGPLWEEVSRKLAELGYQRSAKKCKEKFENVYKYHKRTKEGRTGKADGKTYRFFDQLTAFESQPPPTAFAPPTQVLAPPATAASAQHKPQGQASALMAVPPLTTVSHPPINSSTTGTNIIDNTTVATTTVPSVTYNSSANVLQTPFQQIHAVPTNPTILATVTETPTAAALLQEMSGDMGLMSNSTSSSSSTDVDEEMAEEEEEEGEQRRRRQRKRKWKDFFERLMKEVIQRQEDLQKRFLQAIERREQDRMAREETWRHQEMTRINREREILAQERSVAAAKDAAVMAFLQKISDQQMPPNITNTCSTTLPQVVNIVQPPLVIPPLPQPLPPPPVKIPAPVSVLAAPVTTLKTKPVPVPPGNIVVENNNKNNNKNIISVVDEDSTALMSKSGNLVVSGGSTSSSRWPKTEVHDLIKLRMSMEEKYQENGPKGPLWEEVSAAMGRMGYNRSAKRCKEKWENINKYFKKVKESNKRRPEDSKTCPYFSLLDAIYREKMKAGGGVGEINTVPLMVQPEQQWPPPLQQRQEAQNEFSSATAATPGGSDRPVDEDDDDDEEEEEEEEDEEDEEAGNNYELVASKPNTVGAVE